ncbi:MAG TPA: biotin/lipoyl-binding protein [Falsiroseomonas sp.]|jgi:multidrug resistance efflux pump|nr:biotin/lipoyl-binding protein [Falsiroseomonas sp.]
MILRATLLALACAVTPLGAAAQEAFDCVIEPSLTLRLGSPVTGIVASVEVERGDVVRRGQVVARLEASVEAATLELARARAGSNAEIEARRARRGVRRRQRHLRRARGAAQPGPRPAGCGALPGAVRPAAGAGGRGRRSARTVSLTRRRSPSALRDRAA